MCSAKIVQLWVEVVGRYPSGVTAIVILYNFPQIPLSFKWDLRNFLRNGKRDVQDDNSNPNEDGTQVESTKRFHLIPLQLIRLMDVVNLYVWLRDSNVA